jgi:IS30 family transposase
MGDGFHYPLYRSMALASSVIGRLKDGWSPEQIASRLQLEAGGRRQICHETIYQFVYGGRSEAIEPSEGRLGTAGRVLGHVGRDHLFQYAEV